PAERLLDRDPLLDRDLAAVDERARQAELGLLVAVGDAAEEIETGRDPPARRQVGKRAERVGEEIALRGRDRVPRREPGVAHFMQRVQQSTLLIRCGSVDGWRALYQSATAGALSGVAS